MAFKIFTFRILIAVTIFIPNSFGYQPQEQPVNHQLHQLHQQQYQSQQQHYQQQPQRPHGNINANNRGLDLFPFLHQQQHTLASFPSTQTRRQNLGLRSATFTQTPTVSGGRSPGTESTITTTTTNGNDSWPWRHHVDFNELHPGEDLIADETRNSVQSQQQVLHSQNLQPHQRRQSQSQHRGSETGRRYIFQQQQSRNQLQFPTIPVDSRSESNRHPLWNMFMPGLFKAWWQGPNVCIKREEEDENPQSQPSSRNNNGSGSSGARNTAVGSTTGNNDRQADTNTGSGQPGIHMRMSACEDLDTKHSCTTRVVGPSVSRIIRTDYECCPGYTINERAQECQRGQFENIAKTMEAIGGKKFLEICQSVGLNQKLETETLTVFVPSEEAMRVFLASNPAETNVIPVTSYRDSEEEIRRRRNVLTQHYQAPPLSPVSAQQHGTSARNLCASTTTYSCSQTSQSQNQHSQQQQQQQTQYQRQQHLDQRHQQSRHRDAEIIMNFEDENWRGNALSQQEEFRQQTTYNYDAPNSSPTSNRDAGDVRDSILSHMIEGKISTDEFVDEKVIFSENQDSVIRMNTWHVEGEKINTVNCARMTSINHRCSNGMIHMVDRMLSPVTKSIAEIIDSDTNLNILKSLLERSGILATLREKSQHLTLLAPTDAAFNQLSPSLLARMRNGDPCLLRVLQHHILPISFCSSVIVKKGQIRNKNHGVLNVERNAEDTLFINGSQVISRDVVATNGVVHIIDGVLLSEQDEPLASAIEKAGLTSFLQALQQTRLSLDDMSNVTIFAPSNAAFESLPAEVKNNPQRLREILMYHIGTPETRACHFTHQQEIATKHRDRSIRINLYSNFPVGLEAEVTAQCGRLTKVNNVACNGIIHTVDRVLIPSDMDVAETLRTQSDFSILNRLIAENGLIDTLRAKGPVTIFAPTDAAFYALPREDLEKILNDREEATKVLKSHIISDSLCCSGILPDMWFLTKRVETINGLHVPVSRDFRGQVMFGHAKITTCDLTASNGIIHTVDSIFKVEEIQTTTVNTFMGSCLPQKLDTVDMIAFFEGRRG